MRLRAHHQLFLSYTLLVGAVVVALGIGVEATLRRPLLQQTVADLHRELAVGRDVYEGALEADPDSLARHLGRLTGHRVTVIGPDGTVLGDSGVEPGDLEALESHAERLEVRAAVQDGRGSDVRVSASVGRELVYAAVSTSQGHVLRFATGVDVIEAAVRRVRWQILQVGGVALLLAGILSLAFSVAITRPLRHVTDAAFAMAGGELGRRVHLDRSDELGDLGASLDLLANQLERRIGQLRNEREEMRALIDAMAEGVLAFGPDGTLRRANPAAREMFDLIDDPTGIRPEVVARHPGFLRIVSRALGGETTSPTEIAHDSRHFLATAQPLPPGGAVLVVLDVSELRRLEGVRRDFVANASHELKTPLTVIRGHAETLLGEDLPPELRRRFSESLSANADRLQSILDDLLDLSRIESGGWAPSPEPLELTEVVEGAWEGFTAEATRKGVAFVVDVPEGARQLEADPAALRQIFSNLFSNALRYTGEGGCIEVRARPEPNDVIRVEVRDDGTGIAAPHLDRIFERFYRADPARSRAAGGTGLGLSIVRHLVERHGGGVEAESELGRGTTIRLVIPVRPGPHRTRVHLDS